MLAQFLDREVERPLVLRHGPEAHMAPGRPGGRAVRGLGSRPAAFERLLPGGHLPSPQPLLALDRARCMGEPKLRGRHQQWAEQGFAGHRLENGPRRQARRGTLCPGQQQVPWPAGHERTPEHRRRSGTENAQQPRCNDRRAAHPPHEDRQTGAQQRSGKDRDSYADHHKDGGRDGVLVVVEQRRGRRRPRSHGRPDSGERRCRTQLRTFMSHCRAHLVIADWCETNL